MRPTSQFWQLKRTLYIDINNAVDLNENVMQQEVEAASQDPLDRMTASQVVNILVEAYQNSEYCMAAKARVHEVSQMVSDIHVNLPLKQLQ